MNKKEKEDRDRHFEEKAKWKALPGNRQDLTKAKRPEIKLVTKPQPGGLVLSWV